jgi:hypothetical protein
MGDSVKFQCAACTASALGVAARAASGTESAPTDLWSTGGGIGSVGASPREQERTSCSCLSGQLATVGYDYGERRRCGKATGGRSEGKRADPITLKPSHQRGNFTPVRRLGHWAAMKARLAAAEHLSALRRAYRERNLDRSRA